MLDRRGNFRLDQENQREDGTKRESGLSPRHLLPLLHPDARSGRWPPGSTAVLPLARPEHCHRKPHLAAAGGGMQDSRLVKGGEVYSQSVLLKSRTGATSEAVSQRYIVYRLNFELRFVTVRSEAGSKEPLGPIYIRFLSSCPFFLASADERCTPGFAPFF